MSLLRNLSHSLTSLGHELSHFLPLIGFLQVDFSWVTLKLSSLGLSATYPYNSSADGAQLQGDIALTLLEKMVHTLNLSSFYIINSDIFKITVFPDG